MLCAYTAASARALELYSEADGHDAALLGTLRYTTFRDRLDRVFACTRYAARPGEDGEGALDLLYAELSERDVATMPQLAPDLVRRSDLNGSPGWAWRGSRFLLASCAFGELDRLPWPRRSPTKQRVVPVSRRSNITDIVESVCGVCLDTRGDLGSRR